MTPLQRRLLHQSFSRIEPFSQRLGDIFYARFFSTSPPMRALFSRDIKVQQSKFLKVISEIIKLPLLSFSVTNSLSAETLVPGAYWSGMLHGALGVKQEDFASMKEALLWALSNCPEFEISEAELEAWARAYDILTHAMAGGLQSWYDELAGRPPSVLPPDEITDSRRRLDALTNREDIAPLSEIARDGDDL